MFMLAFYIELMDFLLCVKADPYRNIGQIGMGIQSRLKLASKKSFLWHNLQYYIPTGNSCCGIFWIKCLPSLIRGRPLIIWGVVVQIEKKKFVWSHAEKIITFGGSLKKNSFSEICTAPHQMINCWHLTTFTGKWRRWTVPIDSSLFCWVNILAFCVSLIHALPILGLVTMSVIHGHFHLAYKNCWLFSPRDKYNMTHMRGNNCILNVWLFFSFFALLEPGP